MTQTMTWSTPVGPTQDGVQSLASALWQAREPDTLVPGISYQADELARLLDDADRRLSDTIERLQDWRVALLERRLQVAQAEIEP